jgi:hypothetical protein
MRGRGAQRALGQIQDKLTDFCGQNSFQHIEAGAISYRSKRFFERKAR